MLIVLNVERFLKRNLYSYSLGVNRPYSGSHYGSIKVRQGHSKHSSVVDVFSIGSGWLYSKLFIVIPPGNHSQVTGKAERESLSKRYPYDHLSKPSKPQAVCSAVTLTATTLLSNRTAPVTDPSNKAAGERGLSIPDCNSSAPLTSFQHGRRVLNHFIKITGHIAGLSLP